MIYFLPVMTKSFHILIFQTVIFKKASSKLCKFILPQCACACALHISVKVLQCFVFYIRGMDCAVKQSRIQQSKKRIRDLPHLPNFSATKKFFVQKFQFPRRFKGVAKFISPPQWKFKLGCKKYFPPAKKAFRKPCRERGGEVLEKIQSLYFIFSWRTNIDF